MNQGFFEVIKGKYRQLFHLTETNNLRSLMTAENFFKIKNPGQYGLSTRVVSLKILDKVLRNITINVI